MSPEQILQKRCQDQNDQAAGDKERDISGYDCPDCKNKRLIYFIQGNDIVARQCKCVPIRNSMIRNKASGLSEQFASCSFDSFIDREHWQKDAKRRAMAYAMRPEGWLYICGQVGAGKTLLCSAVAKALIASGLGARYMIWKNEAAELKARVNDPEFKTLLDPLLLVDVLYIDDFMKTERGENGRAVRPTTGDINLAFQIINSRYNSRKITILSSEHGIDDLISFDEATGSRIYERSGNNRIMFPWGSGNNYRLGNT